jgi:predicted DNA-binding protein (MmcQ/YjbR family)
MEGGLTRAARGGAIRSQREEGTMGKGKAAENALIDYAMTFPGAWKDFPWEHTVVKVGKKIFVFFGGAASAGDELSATVKLPVSAEMALTLPFVEKAGHGLWKAGWVNARQKDGEDIDLETYRAWIAQSYRAVAPKKLIKQLDAA